ncbi:MAG: DivIVA domain-containing protein [Lapillicoccus sp.]
MTDQDTPMAIEGGPDRPPNVTHVMMPILDDLTFARREDGGYDPDQVDTFLKDLQVTLDAADNERTALRADVAQLRDRLEDRGHAEIAIDAVGLLSQAQLIADKAIAEAESYARDLMLAARSQYRIVLERAEESAKEAAERAAMTPTATQPSLPFAPVPEIEYVRTYARVAQVQLRAVLDALAEQIDLLGEVPRNPTGLEGAGFATGIEPATREHLAVSTTDVEWVQESV